MKSWIAGVCVVSAGLAGCATIPADRGWPASEALIKNHSSVKATLQPAGDPQPLVDELLAQPLDADAAVRLALLKNPRMQVLYAELGLAQADVYDVSRLTNPTLGYVELSAAGSVAKTTWNLSQRFTELLFLRFNTRIARSRLLQAQQRTAQEVLALEAAVRKAYYAYLGERSIALMRERIAAASTASADYAERLLAAGNVSELQSKREQAAASIATIELRKARSQAGAARGELFKLLGLTAAQHVQFVERLEVPVEQPRDAPALEKWALEQRLDFLATREELHTAELGLKHTRRWRWLGGVELGAEREREANGVAATGPAASVELPLFNPGGGALLRARVRTEQLNAELKMLEIQIRNDIAVQLDTLQAATAVVEEYRERLVPIQQRILELSQQEQNFMLIGTFELLATKQQELAAYQSYIEAVRDYWMTQAELARVAGGRLPEEPQAGALAIGLDGQILKEGNPAAVSGDAENAGHEMPADTQNRVMEHEHE